MSIDNPSNRIFGEDFPNLKSASQVVKKSLATRVSNAKNVDKVYENGLQKRQRSAQAEHMVINLDKNSESDQLSVIPPPPKDPEIHTNVDLEIDLITRKKQAPKQKLQRTPSPQLSEVFMPQLNGSPESMSQQSMSEEEAYSEEELDQMESDLSEDYEDDEEDTKRFTSRHELLINKRTELTKIERLERRGYKGCKKFTMMDSYQKIKDERERLEESKTLDDSIKWQRKALMGTTSGVEYMNKIYDPFDLKLDGWSESIYENIGDYDEVFEELYYKYRTKVQIAPEIRLLGMVGSSAMMFHFSKTLFSKASSQMPGFEDVMASNPELRNSYQQAAMRQMAPQQTRMGSMIGDFVGNQQMGQMVSGLINPQRPPPAPQRAPAPRVQRPSVPVAGPMLAESLNEQEKKIAQGLQMSGPSVNLDHLLNHNKIELASLNEDRLSMSDVASTSTTSTSNSIIRPTSTGGRRLEL